MMLYNSTTKALPKTVYYEPLYTWVGPAPEAYWLVDVLQEVLHVTHLVMNCDKLVLSNGCTLFDSIYRQTEHTKMLQTCSQCLCRILL